MTWVARLKKAQWGLNMIIELQQNITNKWLGGDNTARQGNFAWNWGMAWRAASYPEGWCVSRCPAWSGGSPTPRSDACTAGAAPQTAPPGSGNSYEKERRMVGQKHSFYARLKWDQVDQGQKDKDDGIKSRQAWQKKVHKDKAKRTYDTLFQLGTSTAEIWTYGSAANGRAEGTSVE